MRIKRCLAGACVVALSTAVVGFVCVDRLALAGASTRAALPAPEPSATGSIPVEAKPAEAAAPGAGAKKSAAKTAAASIPNGFDTERLHALMRGDPILPSRR